MQYMSVSAGVILLLVLFYQHNQYQICEDQAEYYQGKVSESDFTDCYPVASVAASIWLVSHHCIAGGIYR